MTGIRPPNGRFENIIDNMSGMSKQVILSRNALSIRLSGHFSQPACGFPAVLAYKRHNNYILSAEYGDPRCITRVFYVPNENAPIQERFCVCTNWRSDLFLDHVDVTQSGRICLRLAFYEEFVLPSIS
jgi:hypothetical protein